MSKNKISQQDRNTSEEAKTCLWFISNEAATEMLIKIHREGISITGYTEYNTLILNRDLNKREYKILERCKV